MKNIDTKSHSFAKSITKYLHLLLCKAIPCGLVIFTMILMSVILLPEPVHAASGSCPLGTTMNFVAHEDDDLLFLNPDIQNDIRAGRCVTTVFLTAGDAGGNSTYWLGRENGEKSAYSTMNSTLNSWTQQDAGVSGHPIPVYTLAGAPNTSLVFLRIPDGNYDGTGFSNYNFESLQKLWQGDILVMTTVDNSSSYTKQSLTNTLLSLMNTYQPDIIRTQNFTDPFNSDIDHSDHYATAYLTQAASQLYATSHILIGYYDYEINSQPQNIFGTNATAKQDTFISYAQFDPFVCQTVSACLITKYGGWFVRQYTAATITPTPTPIPTPTPSPTPAPSPTPSPSPLTNIAPSGSGYRWSQMSSATSNTNRVAASGMNDNNATADISLNGGPDDNTNAYEGAGVIWTSGQNNITKVEYINGSWETSLNGAFTANFQLQTTIDGTTWVNTGISPNPSYDNDSPASSGKTYVFNGILPGNIKGVRVVGQVRTNSASSWVANAREIMVETGSVPPTPTPSPTPSPSPSPTPSPTPTPSPVPSPSPTPVSSAELLSGGAWTLSATNGAAENDTGIASSALLGKSSVVIKYDLHGSQFGSGDDEASIIFIQGNAWFAVNIIPYGTNGLNGIQTITIPLSAFHKVGSPGTILDPTKPVSNLHARFWNKNTFIADILSVNVQ